MIIPSLDELIYNGSIYCTIQVTKNSINDWLSDKQN